MLSWLLVLACASESKAVEEAVLAEMERQGIPGLSILVMKDDLVVHRAAYGKANIELEVAATPENVYNSGSITKTFTALAAMSLVEEGKLALTDAVRKHLPKAPEAWDKVTIKNLLSHTSGLPEYALIEGLGLVDEYTMDQWWEKIGALPLDFEPDTRFAYSNSNYKVLAEVIGAVTGASYYDEVKARVIDKAGLKNTKFRETNEIIPRMATGYLKTGERMIVTPSETRNSAYGAGGIVTCVDDLAQFIVACRDGKVVSKETLAQMQAANRTSDGRRTSYGLGWFVRDVSGHPMVSHGGNTAGYSASMAYFPSQNVIVALMGNVYAFSGDNLAILAARAIEPSLRRIELSEKPDPHPDLTKSLVAVFESLIEGKTDHDALDAAYRGQLESPRGRMNLGGFAQYRDYEGFAYLETKPDDPDVTHTYRIRKGERSFRVVFTVTRDRRVFNVAVLRED